MRRIRPLFVLFAVITVIGYAKPATQLQNVSLLELVVQPEKFDGKTIAVIGYLDVSFDGSLLYVHREDAENWISENAVWVRRTEQMERNRSSLNHKYVKLVGKFKVGYSQQLGDPPNGFSEVQSISLWSDPSSPVGLKKIPGVKSNP